MINNALGVAPVYTPHRPKPVVELGKRSKGQMSGAKKHRKTDLNDSDSDSDDDDYRIYVPLTEVRVWKWGEE